MLNNLTQVSVVMPTLNEAGHIEALMTEIASCINNAGGYSPELIVVDDNSADLTWQIASNLKIENCKIKVIRRMSNPGLTNSLIDGILNSTGDIVVWLDCDFSHPPDKIAQLLFMINQGYSIAVNSRYAIGGGEIREGKGGALQLFLSRVLNWTIRFLLDPRFSDYTSGFIAVKRSVLNKIPISGDYGEYFVDFIYNAIKNKESICELPYWAAPRRTGESKTGTHLIQYLKRGRKYIWTVARLRVLNPIKQFLLRNKNKTFATSQS